MDPCATEIDLLRERLDVLEKRFRNAKRLGVVILGTGLLASALAKTPRDSSAVEYVANGMATPRIAVGDTNADSQYPRPVTIVKSYDATGVASPAVHEGILCQQTWTGDTIAALTRSGIFAVNRYGASGSGGASAGTSIAVGGYSEHRGDGAVTGPVYGGELATTMYDAGSIRYAFGAMGMAQIANASRPASLVQGVGISGAARILKGAVGTMDTAIGVNGSASMDGAGTIHNAIAGHFEVAETGSGTIDTAYGVKIEGVNAGTANNFGLRIAGAGGGSGTNVALQVDSGEVRLKGSLFQSMATADNFFGNGSDANVRMVFDVSREDGTLTYSPDASAFSLNRPLSVSGTAARIASGKGSPEGVVPGAPGSIYLRTDGSAASTLYVKERGTDVTGWRAK